MLTYKKAKKLALAYLNKDSEAKLALYEPGTEFEYGWIFHYTTAGVFHPKLHEIHAKIDRLKKEGVGVNEIEVLLSEKERKLLQNSKGIAGSLPLFIDKASSEISFHKPPTKAIIQEIIEQKTGKKYLWEISIIDDIKGNLNKFKALQSITHLKKTEILNTLRKKAPISKTKSIRELLCYEKILKENKVSYEVKRIENNNVI